MKTTVICVDKTGTVTENRMTVGRWHVAGRDHPQETLSRGAVDLELARALMVAVLCNEAALATDAHGAPRISGSPTEAALLVAARAGGADVAALRERYPLVAMSPRGERRNWMGSMHQADGQRLVSVKGAPEEVLRACRGWLSADGEVALDRTARLRILSANDRMAGEGMRVLGLAFKTVAADAEASWMRSRGSASSA